MYITCLSTHALGTCTYPLTDMFASWFMYVYFLHCAIPTRIVVIVVQVPCGKHPTFHHSMVRTQTHLTDIAHYVTTCKAPKYFSFELKHVNLWMLVIASTTSRALIFDMLPSSLSQVLACVAEIMSSNAIYVCRWCAEHGTLMMLPIHKFNKEHGWGAPWLVVKAHQIQMYSWVLTLTEAAMN